MAPPKKGKAKGGRRNPLEGYRSINFTAETMKDLDGSAARLAGAMGLAGSYQLHRLFSPACPSTETVIAEFVQDRKNDFGHPHLPKHLRAVQAHTVINAVERAGQFTAALLADTPPTLDSPNVTKENLFDVRQMWWSRRYLLTRPADFGARSQLKQQPLVFDAKETFLAWKVLSHFYIQIRKNPRFSVQSTQNNKAVAPQFISTATAARATPGASTVEETRVSALENALAAHNQNALGETDLDDPANLESPPVAALPDVQYHQLVLEIGNALDKPAAARLGRPVLSLSDVEALHTSLCTASFLHAGPVCLYEPPVASAQGTTATHTTATIATSEAIAGAAADERATDSRAETESANRPDPADDHAIEVVRQRQQLQVSARAPSFDAALARLGLPGCEKSQAILHPPNTFEVAPTFLKPWQVTAVAWMLDQEASPLQGGLLTDACGLGKTLSALTLVWSANQNAVPRDPPRTFAPSLILVPNALVDTWIAEIDRHFGDALTLVLFFGSSTRTGDRRRKALTVSKLADLQAILRDLDPANPATGTTVVLSSYQTWARRTTREVDMEGNPVPANRQRSGSARPAPDPHALNPEAEEEPFDEELLTEAEAEAEEAEVVDEVEAAAPPTGSGPQAAHPDDPADPADPVRDQLAELQDADSAAKPVVRRRRFVGLLPDTTFQRVICDEGHRVKSISSRQHQSVAKLARRATWFLTATPMWNKPLDFCGYLSLLWTRMANAAPPAGEDEEAPPSTELDDYRVWSQAPELPETGLPYHLLAPAGLLALSQKGHLTSQVGFDCLPIILRLTCLCREPGHEMAGADGVTVVIGGDIPPLAITTVELRYTRITQVHHDRIYYKIVEGLYERGTEGAARDDDSVAAINWSTFRQLCHLAVHPKLDVFLRRSNSHVLSADISAFGASGDDRGFGLFFARTVEDRATVLPTNRIAVAHYLAHDCPRLRFLLHLLWSEGTLAESGPRPRFLVYCNWPFTRWLVEMFLAALGVDFQVIRAGMSLEARSVAIQQFTNPESTTTVLLTTFHCGALGLNMHAHCSRIVLMEGSPNYNSVFQTIGRIHRLGQSEPQKAWILFQDHTIQRFMEHNCTKKILPQIAAQFRPWLESQVAPVTTEPPPAREAEAEAESDDADNPTSDAGGESTATPAGAQGAVLADPTDDESTDQTLEQLAYKVLGDMLGLAPGAPSRLQMDDYRRLGLDGVTNRGQAYSTRGLASSAPAPVTPVKPHRSRKRPLSPSSEGTGTPSQTPRLESGDPE